MQLSDKIAITFNKFYASLLKDLKSTSDDIKQSIKKNYKVLDKTSQEHIDFFGEQIAKEHVDILVKDRDASTVEALGGKFIAKDVTIASVVKGIDNEVDESVFWNYIYILTTIFLLKEEATSVNEEEVAIAQVDSLLSKVVSILSGLQHGKDCQSDIDDIVDDDIRSLLQKVQKFNVDIKLRDDDVGGEEGDGAPEAMKMPFAGMENSMICNLAKEISNEIDVSNIQVDKPEDVLKLMDFSASNNFVGDIIKKVSSKIHDKISSGELKQEDLFGEAMSMMGMLGGGGGGSSKGVGGLGGLGDLGNLASMAQGLGGLFNNPMVSEMMKSMKKGKATPRADVMKKASARDRLRAKLDERRKKADTDE